MVVFTSDHGDLVGAHGGLMQKWYNAYDEAIRVPLVVRGPGVVAAPEGVHTPTSHVDLLPTLLGLAGIDVERPPPLSPSTTTRPSRCRAVTSVRCWSGSTTNDTLEEPLYFMTEDDVGRGLTPTSIVNGDRTSPCRTRRTSNL